MPDYNSRNAGDANGEFDWRKGLWIGLGVVGFLILFFSTIVSIPAGHEGVHFNILTGKVQPNTSNAGWTLRIPFVTKIIIYDCRRKDYTMSANAQEGVYKNQSDTNWSPTSDGNSVGLDITVWYRIPTNKAWKIYTNLGDQDWCEEHVIRPIIRNAIRLVVAKYDAPEIYGPRRTEVQEKVRELIDKAFKDDGFFILDGDGVFLRDVHLTESYQHSIEEKVAAQQAIQRKQYEVEQAKQEAMAIRIKNDALSSAKSYLQLRTIEMLEKKDFKVMVVPQSQGLILNLQDSQSK
jgi:regulator of protease activity HflC (stomatin/prohibitin superfamily)